jgi:uncharacterized membrane protein YbhN (UPF0104 family)
LIDCRQKPRRFFHVYGPAFEAVFVGKSLFLIRNLLASQRAMTHFLKRFLPLGLGILLLIYALRNVSVSAIRQQFQLADYRWILLVGLLTVITFLVRGARSRQPLLALGYNPTTFRVTIALLAGTLAGMIIPGSGELTRCATLQRTDGVSFSQAVGAVLA